MLSGLVVSMLMTGSPVPDVTSAETVQKHMGEKVAVVGQLERVAIGKGKSEWQGTALVLDDDTLVYVSYGAPPAGWEALIGARVRVEGLLRPSLNDHEQSLLAPHLREPGKPKPEARSLTKALDTRVRLSGTARDAKGGAILLIDNAPLYLAGLESWPSDVHGKQVAVSGKLVDREYLPQARKDKKGLISQGAEGSQLVLEAPTWKLLQEPTQKMEPKK